MTLPGNHTGAAREYRVIGGSEQVVVRQPSGPEVVSLDPAEGPPAGGTPVTIVGNGFSPDATVQFGGQPATDVVVVNSSLIHAVTPPGVGHVDVVVTEPVELDRCADSADAPPNAADRPNPKIKSKGCCPGFAWVVA